MVGRPSWTASSSMPRESVISRNSRPWASSPRSPTSTARPPRDATLAAVLAAPPSTRRVFMASTLRMGTGASGDSREQSPLRYSSRKTSPSTRMVWASNRLSRAGISIHLIVENPGPMYPLCPPGTSKAWKQRKGMRPVEKSTLAKRIKEYLRSLEGVSGGRLQDIIDDEIFEVLAGVSWVREALAEIRAHAHLRRPAAGAGRPQGPRRLKAMENGFGTGDHRTLPTPIYALKQISFLHILRLAPRPMQAGPPAYRNERGRRNENPKRRTKSSLPPRPTWSATGSRCITSSPAGMASATSA